MLLAYLATNTIWLSLMITPILCGHFLYMLNLTLFLVCQIFLLMFPHNLAAPSKPSSAMMDVSSITPPLTHSLLRKGSLCGCLIPTLLCRLVKLSASSTPSIICCVPCFSGFYSVSLLGRSTCMCLDVPAILIFSPKLSTNWHPDPPYVFSSNTLLTTKVIGVLISPPTTSSSSDMLFLMRQISPSLPHPV
jgi:hypothetical protein